MADWQELLALGIVALVVAITFWRWWHRRGRADDGCSGCEKSGAPRKEATLRFHRRKP